MTNAQIGITPATTAAPVPAAPCHCGRPIPASRVAYCSDRCRWDDTVHEDYDYAEDAA